MGWINNPKKAAYNKIYNKTSFSCVVKLAKNMRVDGKDKIDTLNDRMYFVDDNGWKLIDMRVNLE